LIKNNSDKQDKKMNQMMGMINDLHEGLFRLEKKVNVNQESIHLQYSQQRKASEGIQSNNSD
jgi:hypothetical protein